MYNSNIPTQVELPTSGQLLRSTVIAVAAAAAILVTIVLPAEYGIDPTGAGNVLGLTEMGEIKMQLSEEAEADRSLDERERGTPADAGAAVELDGGDFRRTVYRLGRCSGEPRPTKCPSRLNPGQGAEVKLEMKEGATANYSWAVEGGVVNFDTHGDGGGRNTSYEKGRGVPGDEGVLKAAFDGNHGWFWRNRGKAPATVTLRTNGAYASIKRMD